MSCPAVARNQLLLLPSEARGLEPALYVTPVISTGVEKSLTVFSAEPERCAGRSASTRRYGRAKNCGVIPNGVKDRAVAACDRRSFSAKGPLRNNCVRA